MIADDEKENEPKSLIEIYGAKYHIGPK